MTTWKRRSLSTLSYSVFSGFNSAHNRREVPDLLSWVQWFGTYMAIVTSTCKYPERMRQLLAYQTLIVREAQRCRGKGWLAYNSYFHQQVMGDEKADWSRFNQSLYAVTLLPGAKEKRGDAVSFTWRVTTSRSSAR